MSNINTIEEYTTETQTDEPNTTEDKIVEDNTTETNETLLESRITTDKAIPKMDDIVTLEEIMTEHNKVLFKLGLEKYICGMKTIIILPPFNRCFNRNIEFNKDIQMTREQLKKCTRAFEDYIYATEFLVNESFVNRNMNQKNVPLCFYFSKEERILEDTYFPFATISGLHCQETQCVARQRSPNGKVKKRIVKKRIVKKRNALLDNVLQMGKQIVIIGC
jgi:hypothetical protein